MKMLLYLMNIFLSPRLPRQCHGMLRDDRTVGLWCDRLIPRAALYTSPHLAMYSATYSDQCGRGGSQLLFLQRSLRQRGCTWQQTRKGEQMNHRHQQGMEPSGLVGRFKVEEGGNKGETRGRNHERRVLSLVNLSRSPTPALIWLPSWFRWNFTTEYFSTKCGSFVRMALLS